MNQYLKISEFAKLCSMPRKTLIFYDEIGLLHPAKVMENGYRLYTLAQMDTASVISALREIGMSLPEIKNYLDQRSPQALVELLTEQKGVVSAKIDRLLRIKAMIQTRLQMTREGMQASPFTIEVKECAAEPLFVSDRIDCSNEAAAEQVAYDFYDFCDSQGVTYGYPLGSIVSQKMLLEHQVMWPERYFFKYSTAERRRTGYVKPAGLYLIGYQQAYYEVPRVRYDWMFQYMEAHGYVVAGDAYEEFLLDEIAVKEPQSFLMQVSVQVERRR